MPSWLFSYVNLKEHCDERRRTTRDDLEDIVYDYYDMKCCIQYVQLNYSYANLICWCRKCYFTVYRGEPCRFKKFIGIKSCNIAADQNNMTFKGLFIIIYFLLCRQSVIISSYKDISVGILVQNKFKFIFSIINLRRGAWKCLITLICFSKINKHFSHKQSTNINK